LEKENKPLKTNSAPKTILILGVSIRKAIKILKIKVYILSKTHLTMVNLDIIRMSSKGQIVIPVSMRKNLKEGDNLIVIEDEGKIILKKASDMDKQFKEDLEFAKRTEEAYRRIENGEYISVDSENLAEEMTKW
jgi:AbrB family looped-hinge helix DNA binding protein